MATKKAKPRTTFTVAEVAADLGITTEAVRKAIRLGTIAAEQVNSYFYLIGADQVELYRANHLGRPGRRAGHSPQRKKVPA